MRPSRIASSLTLATLAAWPARARADVPFASAIEGIELRPEAGTGIYGYELTGNLGAMSLGVRQLDERWLVSWDGAAELVAGAIAYEHPFYPVYGARAAGQAEGGLRLRPAAALSAYASAALEASASAITQAGEPLDAGPAINNPGSFGGLLGSADLRPGFGASYLDSAQSLVAEAQLLGELDGPQSNGPGLGYLGGALHARYDRRRSFTAIGDLSYAVTPSWTDAALGTSTAIGRWTLSASAVKALGHFFAGLGLSVSRSEAEVAYAGAATYASAAPIDSRLWLLVGYWP